jgi:alanine dehydrogenase
VSVPWFTEADIKDLLTLTDVLEPLEAVLGREVDEQAINIPKAMATWDPASSAHTLGGVDLVDQLAAFKTWVNTPKGAKAILTLFDSENGEVLAVMEAAYLGSLRTASVSGVATRWMAAEDAAELAIIGSGRQALRQVEAIVAVRPIRKIRVWSPTAEHRAEFAGQVRETTGLETVAAPTLAAATKDAPIVTLVTRAREPFLTDQFLAPGTHMNAVGSVLPPNAEFDPALLAGADLVVVDNVENARRSSRELREFYGEDMSKVQTLGSLIASNHTRDPDTRLSVFKGLGMGLADLAAAAAVARKAGLGRNTR